MRNATQQQAWVLLAILMLAGTACAGTNVSDPGAGNNVQVTLAKDAYLSGETVNLVLKNVSNASVEYAGSLCRRVLQRQQQNGAWSTVEGPSKICTLELRYLGVGKSVPLPYGLPQDLPTGLYRIQMPSPTPENAQPPEPDVTTQPFSVTLTSSK